MIKDNLYRNDCELYFIFLNYWSEKDENIFAINYDKKTGLTFDSAYDRYQYLFNYKINYDDIVNNQRVISNLYKFKDIKQFGTALICGKFTGLNIVCPGVNLYKLSKINCIK